MLYIYIYILSIIKKKKKRERIVMTIWMVDGRFEF